MRLPGFVKGSIVGKAKDLIVKPIAAKDANRIVKALHYSGKVVSNSQVHLGVFMGDKCGGAMQFGPSLDKRKIQGLVTGTLWNEFIELNRMAFADWLPRNGESRCIGYAMRWIKKTYPWIKWIISFADGTQCGDGTIYRASGFYLTGIKVNNQIWAAPDGSCRSRTALTDNHSPGSKAKARATISRTTMTKSGNNFHTGAASMKAYEAAGFRPLSGFQLRYIYFLDPTAKDRLTVPILPFSEIDKRGAAMYKGKPIQRDKQAMTATSGTAEGQHLPSRSNGSSA
jgi:hypothetical protein